MELTKKIYISNTNRFDYHEIFVVLFGQPLPSVSSDVSEGRWSNSNSMQDAALLPSEGCTVTRDSFGSWTHMRAMKALFGEQQQSVPVADPLTETISCLPCRVTTGCYRPPPLTFESPLVAMRQSSVRTEIALRVRSFFFFSLNFLGWLVFSSVHGKKMKRTCWMKMLSF